MKDYGFDRCCSAEETEGLMCVCSSLFDACGVRSHVLHEWVAKGDKKLVEEISCFITLDPDEFPSRHVTLFNNNCKILTIDML
ncbi:hypothetical protein CH063_03978 [Colletotrichum higginsianum]|uniref:Uncharacterized protein n=1 Tax=Colletotrichum higginsianum (strain IMI 349063) TaxID=759273 RepID=H1W340_COLHI|nr:hypothetical protein CH63R_05929 [Colletotrichum higginsianum IMI 349063]OBR10237.1 hypothetical protein CH63R_05929 [Colletotrichum higginsianum IMI 349063]GJD02750.1 hypothetical protein ColKHC_11575 [Colletotrichum higginsianum]CCF46903.1 hypothetical protein CH063_03978 [Colletotrichum higginsianum]